MSLREQVAMATSMTTLIEPLVAAKDHEVSLQDILHQVSDKLESEGMQEITGGLFEAVGIGGQQYPNIGHWLHVRERMQVVFWLCVCLRSLFSYARGLSASGAGCGWC